MRLRVGGIPDSPDFVAGEDWKPLKEPTPWLMQLFALPLGIVLFVFFVWAWANWTPLGGAEIRSIGFLVLGLASFAPLIVFHELIHMWVHPEAGRSGRSILGFWPSRLLFFAHYDGELTRERFLAIVVMPLLVISCLPLTVSITAGTSHSLVAWLSCWNALFACGDVFAILLVIFQVPSGAIVRNKGWRTYWKVR